MAEERFPRTTGAGAPVDVLVVGAGPTGLSLAGQANAAGASVRIIDRLTDRTHESRALAVQPRTLEVLRGLGVSQSLVDRGRPAVALRLHCDGRVVSVPLFDVGIDDTQYPYLLFISQAETEAVLTDRLAACHVPVERGVELIGFDANQDRVVCRLRRADGGVEEVRALYLAGCDGAHSTVRHGAGIAFEGGAYPQTFVLGDLEVDGDLERGAAHVFVATHGVLFFFPLGQPATWRMLGFRPGSAGPRGADQRVTQISLDQLQAICNGFTGGTLRLRDPVWMTAFRLHHRQAASYQAGRVFLVGDAAHVHSPAGGQGMNTGIQDAWNLGWKLALVARGFADTALLDSYEAERWPVGRFVLNFTDRASVVATSDSAPARFVRGHVVGRLASLVARLPLPRAQGFRTLAQLDVRYRRSPAVAEGQPVPRRGARAGDRLPDARVAVDGQARWLQEVLAAPHFHLLLCGAADAWHTAQLATLQARYGDLLTIHRLSAEASPGALLDVVGEAFSRLGVEGAAHHLIRPDGHIGFRACGTNLDGVATYLARWLPQPGTL